MIDPYSYRERLTMPKLLINGTNDRYWTLDSLNLFWDDLQGPKWVVYLPNAGHGLQEHRDFATHGIGAFFRHTISSRPVPSLTWESSNANGSLSVTVHASQAPKAATFWVARSDTRDFREVRWESSPPDPARTNGALSHAVPKPKAGYVALFGDLAFEIDGLEYHLSSEIYQAGPVSAK
jgi:PhoPQ-activated pathogenicity-related protein